MEKGILASPKLINVTTLSGVTIKAKEGSKVASPKELQSKGQALWAGLIKKD